MPWTDMSTLAVSCIFISILTSETPVGLTGGCRLILSQGSMNDPLKETNRRLPAPSCDSEQSHSQVTARACVPFNIESVHFYGTLGCCSLLVLRLQSQKFWEVYLLLTVVR